MWTSFLTLLAGIAAEPPIGCVWPSPVTLRSGSISTVTNADTWVFPEDEKGQH